MRASPRARRASGDRGRPAGWRLRPPAGPRGGHNPLPPRSGQPGGSAGEPTRPRRTAVLALTAGGLLLADLVTKIIVVAELMGREPVTLPGGFLWLTHARNPGAAFSFAEGATVVFTAVAAIVVVVIIRTATRLRSAAWAVSLGLVLGGAAGNLVDRLFRSPGPLRGHVVDWISLRTPDGRMLFPIFNLADSGIVCGGILAVLLALLGYEMDGTRSSPRPTPDPPPPGPDTGPGPGAGPGSGAGPGGGPWAGAGPGAGPWAGAGPGAGPTPWAGAGPGAGTGPPGSGPWDGRAGPGTGGPYVPSAGPLAGPLAGSGRPAPDEPGPDGRRPGGGP